VEHDGGLTALSFGAPEFATNWALESQRQLRVMSTQRNGRDTSALFALNLADEGHGFFHASNHADFLRRAETFLAHELAP